MSGAMEAFGVRFAVIDPQRRTFVEAKKDKDAGAFRGAKEWASLVPDDIKSCFTWLTKQERDHWASVRNSAGMAIPEPADLPTIIVIPITRSGASLRFPGTVEMPATTTNRLASDSVLLVFQVRA